MSLKTVLQCIGYDIKQYLMNLQKKDTEFFGLNELKKVQFDDISEYFPKEYFILDFEPLYAFQKMIYRKDVMLFTDNIEKYKELINLLETLFIEKALGMQRLFFSDFSGVTCSKDKGNCSFSVFKNKQYEINNNHNDFKYTDYDLLMYDIFNTDKYGNTNALKDAIILNWSNSIYVNNRDRSHRFALLCKWNEIENRNDSEFFKTMEISVNKKTVEKLLEDYCGFIISSQTAKNIIATISNDTFVCWKRYAPFGNPIHTDYIGFFICRKETNKNLINFFLQEQNSISINELLAKTL